ncbi:unnamed protein product, partial [Mycena citricolor]
RLSCFTQYIYQRELTRLPILQSPLSTLSATAEIKAMADGSIKHRVLITGFGPFHTIVNNPSWLAVQTLHDLVINTTPPRGQPPKGGKPELVHITSLYMPVVYSAVLRTVPGLHAAPPVLPASDLPPEGTSLAPPEDGYSLIVHVGVAGPGILRAERLGHKSGYRSPDHEGAFAPEIGLGRRGFGGARYGVEFADELRTAVDVDGLTAHLTTDADPLEIVTSNDAGRFLCDFIYYCSLAESQRAGRKTPVLFIHCPPVDESLSTERVAGGLVRIISYICGQL